MNAVLQVQPSRTCIRHTKKCTVSTLPSRDHNLERSSGLQHSSNGQLDLVKDKKNPFSNQFTCAPKFVCNQFTCSSRCCVYFQGRKLRPGTRRPMPLEIRLWRPHQETPRQIQVVCGQEIDNSLMLDYRNRASKIRVAAKYPPDTQRIQVLSMDSRENRVLENLANPSRYIQAHRGIYCDERTEVRDYTWQETLACYNKGQNSCNSWN